MVISCFFCQNLLSDFVEGLLPSVRHSELKGHLEGCRDCTEVHHDLTHTLEVLHALPPRPLSHEMALRITEASKAGSLGYLNRRSVSRVAFLTIIPLLAAISMVYAFPGYFPWFSRFRHTESAQFVRYFPLLQGAVEIIEEQANWIHAREPVMRSLWEEGGLSPEEFEKTFQGKSAPVREVGGTENEAGK